MAAPVPNYTHRARLARQDEIPTRALPVSDGDTFHLRLDLGTYVGVRVDPVVRIRLAGIDTWELHQPNGLEARAFTLTQLLRGVPVTVATEKPIVSAAGETLGRTVGRVWIGDDDLADLLRAAGFEKTA